MSVRKYLLGFAVTFLGVLTILRCSNAEMKGGSSGRAASKDVRKNPPLAAGKGELSLSILVSGGEKTSEIRMLLKPTSPAGSSANAAVEYTQVPDSLTHSEANEFPAERAAQIAKSRFKAHMSPSPDGSKELQITMETSGITDDSGPVAPATLTFKANSGDGHWTKTEGAQSALGASGASNSTNCAIEASGNQPRVGLHAVILTKPAPCDFKMPTVTVGRTPTETGVVPIGTYWEYAWPGAPTTGWKRAHTFAVTAKAPKTTNGINIGLDNGYLLVQPDGVTYLLVDAGVANPANPAYKDAATIANDLSRSLNFGNTTLKQPVAGSAADNYATATVFKKGSVIAIYDDTPDMAGVIDVKALINSVNSTLSLSWEAMLGK
jgi:hypothetical protein